MEGRVLTDARPAAARVPIMAQRAKRPVVARATKPSSAAMLVRRDISPPEPPAPALLTLESSESAGCEMMAAATPAMTPEPSETQTLPPLLIFEGSLPMPA